MLRWITCFLLFAFGVPLHSEDLQADRSEKLERQLEQAVVQARVGNWDLFENLITLVAGDVADKLVPLLDDPDPNVRLAACRAIGYSGRLDCWPRLSERLRDGDWRVAYATCLSLIQLKAKDAKPALEKLAVDHWYPRVRSTAKYAIQRLESAEAPDEMLVREVGHPISDPPEKDFSAFDWTTYSLVPLADARVGKLHVARKDMGFVPWDRFPNSPKDSKIRTFRTLHPEAYEAISAENEKGDSEEWAFTCRLIGLLEKDGTTFVALSAGEWVGGLFAVKNGKATTLIGGDDLSALLEWNGKIMAFVGLRHMGMDHGGVYEIVPGNPGWTAKYVYALPGYPGSGGVLPDGRLFANCQGGAVAIAKDGTFEYLGSGEKQPRE